MAEAESINRLAKAQEAVAGGLGTLTAELAVVERRRAEQVDRFQRMLEDLHHLVSQIRLLLFVSLGVGVVVVMSLLLIVSAVMPGVPLLRIDERNQAKTAEVVRQLNCAVAWNNGNRFEACADVVAVLDAQALSEGIAIPGARS